MLRSVSVMSVLLMGLAAQADEQPADALAPVNGPIATVRAEKVITEEAGPHDWLIKHETILKLVELTNQHRARMGVGPVVLDTQMCLDAQRHATWMANYG